MLVDTRGLKVQTWFESIWTVTVRVMVIMFALLFILGFASVVLGDEREPQSVCFLRQRPGGSARMRWAEQREWVHRLQRLVDAATAGDAFPTSGTVLAVAFHESSWKTRARGSRGEHGLMQVLPERLRALGLRRGEDPLTPEVNLRLGVAALRQCREACGEDLTAVMTCYAAGQCSSGDRRVRSVVDVMVRWARQAEECADGN